MFVLVVAIIIPAWETLLSPTVGLVPSFASHEVMASLQREVRYCSLFRLPGSVKVYALGEKLHGAQLWWEVRDLQNILIGDSGTAYERSAKWLHDHLPNLGELVIGRGLAVPLLARDIAQDDTDRASCSC